MTREARMFSGIILITVPTIQYGGYFLLTSLMNNKTSGYTVEPPRPEGRGFLDYAQRYSAHVSV